MTSPHARFATGHKGPAAVIAIAWLVAAVGLSLFAPDLQEVGTVDDAAMLPDTAASQRATRVIGELFPDDPGRNQALIVVARDTGLEPADDVWLAQVLADVESDPDIPAVAVLSVDRDPALTSLLSSEDGAARMALVELTGSPFEPTSVDAVHALRDRLIHDRPSGLSANVTGIAGLGADQADAIIESIDRTALITVVLILAILLWVYRSPIAALVPLVTIGIALQVSRGVIALIADSDVTVAANAETFIIVLVFGAGTDYTLFLVSRYREEVGNVDVVGDPMRRTRRIIGPVIAAAAATVAIGFLSMVSGQFGLYTSVGPAVALSIVITVVAGLTLTPALLRLAGRRAFWPGATGGPAHGASGEGRWQRVADVVAVWPREVLLGGTAVLLLMSTGLGWFQQSLDLVSDLPESADARVGFETLSDHYPGGALAPIHVVITADRAIDDHETFAAIDWLTDELRAREDLASVRSITQPAGTPLRPDTLALLTGTEEIDLAALGIDPDTVDITPLLEAMESERGLRVTPALLEQFPQFADRLTPFLGVDGRSARLVLELAGNPFAESSLQAIRAIDRDVATLLAGSALEGAVVHAGGPAAFYVDVQDVANRDFVLITIVLLLGIFIVLAGLLRSLVAPLYLLATVLLSYAATLGLTVVVSPVLFGTDTMVFWMPVFLLVILVALGADYNIFIMSRIREEADKGLDLPAAALRGLVKTGGVITSAGLILAGTFAVLVIAPMPNLRQVGFAVTVGILIDTFVVRSILVPAATILLGDRALWPSKVGAPSPTPLRRALPLVTATMGLVALLVAALAAPGVDPEVVRIEAGTFDSSPTPRAVAAEATPADGTLDGASSTAPDAGAPTTSSAGADDAASGQAGGPTSEPTPTPAAEPTATPAAEPTSSPTDPTGPSIGVPVTGDWSYHVVGSRKIGAVGTPQGFDETVATRVERVGGPDHAPILRLTSDGEAGSTDVRREHRSDQVRVLEQHQSASGLSQGGPLTPPPTVLFADIGLGDEWTASWTSDGTQSDATFRVSGRDTHTVGSTAWDCIEVTVAITMTGSFEGREDQVTCWILDLGMPARQQRDIEGRADGVYVQANTDAVLTEIPS